MKPYYEEAGITIYHGDCRDVLPSVKANLLLTDPPYGVGEKYGLHNDTREGYEAFASEWFQIARNAAPLLIFTPGIRNLWLYPAATWVMPWVKPGATQWSDLGGFNEWEPILVYGKRKIYGDMRILHSLNYREGDPATAHPCQKPPKLLTWLVSVASDETDTICDPFLGSGTALRAAKDLGRRAIGIEIEEKYCEIAAKRLSQSVMNFGGGK